MNKRNFGIDLLRCISMLFVVILHTLGHGGVLRNVTSSSPNYYIAWLIEISAYCAVNCYALISGFVGYKSNYKYSNIIFLWVQVFFYSTSISIFFQIINPASIGLKEILTSFLPVLKGDYWYFTSYFALFFLMPLFNKGINALSKSEAKTLVIATILIFCFIRVFLCFDTFQLFNTKDLFITNSGYSVFWLSLLYIIGGCLGKSQILETFSTLKLILIYSLCIVFTCAFKFLIENISLNIIREQINPAIFIEYISPTIVLSAIALLGLFSRLDFKSQKLINIIKFFAPISFGVYLIHEHPMIKFSMIFDKFIFLANTPPLIFIISLIGIVMAIYISCSLIDYARLLLFNTLKIKETITKLLKKFKKV